MKHLLNQPIRYLYLLDATKISDTRGVIWFRSVTQIAYLFLLKSLIKTRISEASFSLHRSNSNKWIIKCNMFFTYQEQWQQTETESRSWWKSKVKGRRKYRSDITSTGIENSTHRDLFIYILRPNKRGGKVNTQETSTKVLFVPKIAPTVWPRERV